MNSVTEFIKALGAARLAAMGAVALGLIGFFAFMILKLSQPQMGVLYTDLTFNDSIAVIKRLEGLNIKHQVRQEGAIILVPKKGLLRLRMTLAEDGLPAGGAVGYEIFDNADTLGSTSFVQNINRLRAIEGELARSIRSINRVQAARVHLVLPKRKLFARSAAEPTASIVIKVNGSLNTGQIKSIQHLVASAVEGLQPEHVSIVDEGGKLLASGRGDGTGPMNTTLDERARAIETRTQRDIEDIVSSIVGAGRVRVRVTAEIDYNKITETSDIYDPEGQVVRSTQSREENSSAATPSADGSVSVGNELPAANGEADGGIQKEDASKSEEVVNYEISKTTKTEIVEGGRVKRLSVAVLVDGIYNTAADGKQTYAPRAEEELKKITALVHSAIGYDKARGDLVHVANLRFASRNELLPADADERGMLDFTPAEIFHIAELFILALVSLLVLLFVVRPLIRRIITPEPGQSAEDMALEWRNSEAGQLAAPANGKTGADGEPALLPPPDSEAHRALENVKKLGEIQAGVIREVGEVVDKNPQEAVTIIRNWIQQEA